MKNVAVLFITLILLFSCKNEIHKEYYDDGKLKLEYRKQGRKFVGEYIEYYHNGLPHVKGQFKNGIMDGKWEYFYLNGKQQSIEDRINGIVINFNYWDSTGMHQVIDGNGTAYGYYPSGKIKSKAEYKNSKPDGKFETWFPNGQIQNEFYYTKGIPTGIWKYWDENGILIKTEKYP